MKVSYSPTSGTARDKEVFSAISRQMARAARGVKDDQLTDDAKEMRLNRRVAARQARTGRLTRTAYAGGGGPGGAGSGFSDLQFATGRPRDPLFYWRQNNLPYDFSQNEELAKVRSFCRLVYQTDPIIGACVDVFSKFPTIGARLEGKDQKLNDFYEEQFFGEDNLNYHEFLIDMGREFYTAGEAWPFATFDEDLGIWSDEELLNPDDIKVERSPFLKEPRFFIRLPWSIRQVLQTRQPVWEYNKLIEEYPELSAYTSENSFMPVSNVLLKQLKFRGDTFNVRGLPLLTRAMRSLLQQEMLNTALDSVADRLYTPLILCKLGASASDLGTSVPWIPTDDDLENFELALDAALAADFRALVYNFGVSMEPVLGREQMPDLTPDFERIEDRMLMVFGMSRTLLNGAGDGQTYAADALNRDLIVQLMSRFQKYLAAHFRSRALIVAEAQEHYDYEESQGRRYVIMEEVLETDEETGEKRIVEQPKLLVPELRFATLNLKDNDVERQFIEALRASGMPISQRTRSRNLGIDLDEEIERSKDEAVEQIVAEQEVRRRAYLGLRDKGLPIPQDLAADFAPYVQVEGIPAAPGAPLMPQPQFGDQPVPLPDLAPTPEDMMAEPPPGEEPMAEGEEPLPPGEEEQRPEESDEMRDSMPKAASRPDGMPSQAALFRRTARVRTMATVQGIQRATEAQDARADGWPMLEHTAEHEGARPWQSGPAPSCYGTPAHVGVRRYLGVTREDEELVSPDRYARPVT